MKPQATPNHTGRGSSFNPQNRFEQTHIEFDPLDDHLEHQEITRPRTQYFKDSSRSILSYNTSPDIPFEVGLSPYRGCEHGCSYCFARPYHEYLGFSSGLDFESKIMVKFDAPTLLHQELSAKRYEPKIITMSAITDIYQPLEQKLKITRECLKVLLEFRQPVVIITKNHLVTRDIDLLQELAKYNCISVAISLTTLSNELRLKLEPRTSSPERRLAAICALAEAGVPVGVMTAPVIPGLTDHELPSLIEAATQAGASWAGYTMLRLPYAVKDIFLAWLEQHVPDRAQKIIHRIEDIRGGKLNNSDFGSRMRGQGIFAEQINKLFKAALKKSGLLERERIRLSTAHFRIPTGQAGLFD